MSMFVSYKAVRAFHIGQIRLDVKLGDVLLFDGVNTQIAGTTFTIPLVEKVIKAGWLTVIPTNFALTVAASQAAEKQIVRSDKDAAQFIHPEAKAADGVRPQAGKQHVWDTADWLNSEDGFTCKVCGATKLHEGSFIRLDLKRGNGKQLIHYRDAHGREISSHTELSCPIWVGDVTSTLAQTKEVVRNVRSQVDVVEGRVGGVEARLETTEDRLLRLEAENELLQQQLIEKPIIDATQVAEALYALMEKRLASTKVTIIDDVKYLPLPNFDDVIQEIKEPVLLSADGEE